MSIKICTFLKQDYMISLKAQDFLTMILKWGILVVVAKWCHSDSGSLGSADKQFELVCRGVAND